MLKRPAVNRRIRKRVPLSARLRSAAGAVREWAQSLPDRLHRRAQPEPVEAALDPDDEVTLPQTSWAKRLLWVAAVGCALLALALVLSMNDFLTRERKGVVSRVVVSGNQRVPTEVIQSAGHTVYGAALMTLDRTAAAKAVERLPWIRRATVEPQLPDAVHIRVVEYEPYALQLSDGALFIVDKEGYVFKKADPDEAFDLPILTGMKVQLSRQSEVEQDKPVGEEAVAAAKRKIETAEERKQRQEAELLRKAERRRLQEVLALLEAHARSPLAELFPLSEVHCDAVLGTTLISAKDGAEIRIGRHQERNLQATFAVIERLLRDLDARGEWLQYALLDDELHVERAVVQAGPKGRPRPAAAVEPPTPQAPPPEAEGMALAEPAPAAKPAATAKPAPAAKPAAGPTARVPARPAVRPAARSESAKPPAAPAAARKPQPAAQ